MCIQLTLTVFLALRRRISAKHIDAVNRELTAENAERRRAEESLHKLSSRLLTLQDEERRRIARELHDSTAQVLYGLSIQLRLLSDSSSSETSRARGALAKAWNSPTSVFAIFERCLIFYIRLHSMTSG